MTHEKDFFINLDHAIAQFRDRAKTPPDWNKFHIEREIRSALETAQVNNTFINSRFEGEKLCRIAHPDLDVVYAVLEPGHEEGQYKWMVHTVFTQEMYHSWSKEGRLGTLGENINDETEEKLRAAIENHRSVMVKMETEEKDTGEETMFLIEHKDKKGGSNSIKVPESKVDDYITALILSGTALSDVKIYKPIDFKISINFEGE